MWKLFARGNMLSLPRSIQEIANAIGVERALFLVSQLPRCYWPDKRYPGTKSEGVILYVPKAVTPEHSLVRILGWIDAQKMVRAFGGEMLKPAASCADLYRPFRNAGIQRLVSDGVPVEMVADWFDLSEKHVLTIVGEIPRGERRAANSDNGASTKYGRRKNDHIQKTG